MKRKLFSILAKLFTTALISVMLFALFLNISTLLSIDKIKKGESVTSGYFCAMIASGSMEPALSVNDLLLIKGARSYQNEDIVTYVSPRGSMITHRIKDLLEQGYITQGDANNISDGEIPAQRVLGSVVLVIPGVGGFINGILSPAGIILLICVFLLVRLFQRIRRDQNEEERNNTYDTPCGISENRENPAKTDALGGRPDFSAARSLFGADSGNTGNVLAVPYTNRFSNGS